MRASRAGIGGSVVSEAPGAVEGGADGARHGVFEAARDMGIRAIGVDSDQHDEMPGTVVTSMIKRVDVAVFDTVKAVGEGRFEGGIRTFGVKEDGVGYAMDDNNAKLVTPEMKAAVEKAKADIIAGTVKVHDYMSSNSCPM